MIEILLQTLADRIVSNPVTATILAAALLMTIYAANYADRHDVLSLGWIRQKAWRGAHGISDTLFGRSLISDQSDNPGQYVTTTGADVGESDLIVALMDAGAMWNPQSTQKYTTMDDKKSWSIFSLAFRDSMADDEQTHVYAFRRPDGKVDLYSHKEASITDVDDHHNADGVIPGDPEGHIEAALEDAGIKYEENKRYVHGL